MRYAVLIPVYNERDLFPLLLGRLLESPPPADTSTGEACERVIVIVDDGSGDGSGDLVERAAGEHSCVHAVCHASNRGKGAAIRTALEHAMRLEPQVDVFLIQDADLEYDPSDHADVLGPILGGKADAVIGSRFIGGTHRVLYYWHSLANRFITTCSNTMTNLNLTDIECCFKAFTRDVGARLEIEEDRFGIEPEFVARVARMRLPVDGSDGVGVRRTRVYEVPVSYDGRTYEEGKKITWRDGVRALWCVVKYSVMR